MKLQGKWQGGNYSGDPLSSMGFGPSRSQRRMPAVIFGIVLFFVLFVAGSMMIVSFTQTEASIRPPEQAIVEKPAPVEMEEVIVPIKGLESGQFLDPSLLVKISLPRSSIPLGAVRMFEELDGKYINTSVAPNQPILKAFLLKEKPHSRLEPQIPPGYRAVTISVNATTGVEGWTRAHSRVDVQWLTTIQGNPAIKCIAQNVEVLSADRSLDPKADPATPVPATVTLLATKADADKISITSTNGSLILHMRGSKDKETCQSCNNTLLAKDMLANPSDDGDTNGGIVKFGNQQWFVDGSNIIAKH